MGKMAVWGAEKMNGNYCLQRQFVRLSKTVKKNILWSSKSGEKVKEDRRAEMDLARVTL